MSTSTFQYLDRALGQLRDLGLMPEKTEEAPIVALLQRISDIDEDKVLAIARTLSCLLYTSPSPRDATLSRMPSSA